MIQQIKNVTIRKIIQVHGSIVDIIKRKCLKWFSHFQKRPETGTLRRSGIGNHMRERNAEN